MLSTTSFVCFGCRSGRKWVCNIVGRGGEQDAIKTDYMAASRSSWNIDIYNVIVEPLSSDV